MHAVANPWTPPSRLWPTYEYRVQRWSNGWHIWLLTRMPGERPRFELAGFDSSYTEALDVAYVLAKEHIYPGSSEDRNPNPVRVLDEHGRCYTAFLVGREIGCANPPRRRAIYYQGRLVRLVRGQKAIEAARQGAPLFVFNEQKGWVRGGSGALQRAEQALAEGWWQAVSYYGAMVDVSPVVKNPVDSFELQVFIADGLPRDIDAQVVKFIGRQPDRIIPAPKSLSVVPGRVLIFAALPQEHAQQLAGTIAYHYRGEPRVRVYWGYSDRPRKKRVRYQGGQLVKNPDGGAGVGLFVVMAGIMVGLGYLLYSSSAQAATVVPPAPAPAPTPVPTPTPINPEQPPAVGTENVAAAIELEPGSQAVSLPPNSRLEIIAPMGASLQHINAPGMDTAATGAWIVLNAPSAATVLVQWVDNTGTTQLSSIAVTVG